MEKIKQFFNSDQSKDILVVLIVILVGLGAFILGRLSAQNTQNSPNTTNPTSGGDAQNEETSAIFTPSNDIGANVVDSTATTITTPEVSTQIETNKPFFASKKGKKYYPVNCSAGKDIKPENRIYFETSTAAEQAGYTLSSSCN